MAGKMSITQRKWILTAHLLFMVAWLGMAFCVFVLGVIAARTGSADLSRIAYSFMLIFDGVPPRAGVGTAITGVLLGVFTNWGLTKYYWLIVKELATIGLILLGFWIHFNIEDAAAIVSAKGLRALQDPTYHSTSWMIVLASLTQVILLSSIVAISVFKPWGKRKK